MDAVEVNPPKFKIREPHKISLRSFSNSVDFSGAIFIKVLCGPRQNFAREIRERVRKAPNAGEILELILPKKIFASFRVY